MPITNKDLLNQIHLSGESRCPAFQAHMLKANFCVACSKLINKHSPEAIPNDEALLKVRDQLQPLMHRVILVLERKIEREKDRERDVEKVNFDTLFFFNPSHPNEWVLHLIQ